MALPLCFDFYGYKDTSAYNGTLPAIVGGEA
jgi:hypothetical protein